MKFHNKKGFTIVELVIVIAIIAILAAVLIPTFSSIVQKANLSADQQAIRNMNTQVAVAKASTAYENVDVIKVYSALKEANYDIAAISPKSSKAVFGFGAETLEVGLFDSETKELIYAPSASEMKNVVLVGDNSFDFYLSENFDLNADLWRANVNIYSDKAITVNINGTIIGNVTVDAANATINQSGIIDGDGYGSCKSDADNYVFNKGILSIESASSVWIHGYIDQLLAKNANVTVAAEGVIRQINSGCTALNLTVNGWVNYVASTTGITVSNNGYYNGTKATAYEYQTNFVLQTTEDLLKLSAKTLNGSLPYMFDNSSSASPNPITILLENDIDITKIGYIPLATIYANNYSGVSTGKHLSAGINGNGKSIIGLRQNFIGTLGAGSSVSNLKLVFDYEAEDYTSPFEQIFYNGASNGLITPYFIKSSEKPAIYNTSSTTTESYTDDFYMHIGCLANNIENYTSTPIDIDNLTVDGKLKFKNLDAHYFYVLSVIAGGAGGATSTPAFAVNDLILTDDFELSAVAYEGNVYYTQSPHNTNNLPSLYYGDNANGLKIKVTYSDSSKIESTTLKGESSVYSGFVRCCVPAGTIVNE